MNNGATQRVVALVDMDCFYCQVETRLNPTLKGKPLAVVQYNQWKGGGIIAVNYEARDRGVSRHMRGDEAKEICPEIILVPVPTIRGKADLSNYRDAGDEVAKVFSEFSDCVQRASIDEAYLDLTKAVERCSENQNEDLSADDLQNTFVVGFCDLKNKSDEDRKKGLNEWLNIVNNEKTKDSPEYQLAIGAKIVEEMRSEIFKRTGFHCSAGIAHNKILAKLTAGLHKPKRQTILPQDSVPELYNTLPIHKVRNLGGKFGKQVVEKLSISYMSELYNFSLGELQKKFDEKTSAWLYNIARGIDLDPVTSRLRPESVGCCKNFTGKNALTTKTEVAHWLKELATEISERLFKDLKSNKRRAKLLTVSFCQEAPMTRCSALNSYEVARIVNDALELLKKFNCASGNEDVWTPPIKYLGLSASKFTEEISSIEKYLKSHKEITNKAQVRTTSTSVDINNDIVVEKEVKSSCDASNNNNNNINKSKDETADKSNNKTKENFYELTKPSSSTSTDISNGVVTEKEVKSDTSKNFINKSKDEAASTSSEHTRPSFFLEFLKKKKDSSPEREVPDEPELEIEEEEKEDEGETWISLSEVFPDINQADAEVVKNLPEPLQKKFRERIKSENGNQEPKQNLISEILTSDTPTNIVKETCRECGKTMPVSELPVHSDYHAALKLYSEINKPVKSAEPQNTNKRKSKDAEGLTKRKKKGSVSPIKKMKSLTSFFAPVTKK